MDKGAEVLFDELKETLAAPPMYTTLRVNTLQSDRDAVKQKLYEIFSQVKYIFICAQILRWLHIISKTRLEGPNDFILCMYMYQGAYFLHICISFSKFFAKFMVTRMK